MSRLTAASKAWTLPKGSNESIFKPASSLRCSGRPVTTAGAERARPLHATTGRRIPRSGSSSHGCAACGGRHQPPVRRHSHPETWCESQLDFYKQEAKDDDEAKEMVYKNTGRTAARAWSPKLTRRSRGRTLFSEEAGTYRGRQSKTSARVASGT